MYQVNGLICFKLILTSFYLALFCQVLFSVIPFFAGVISSFQFASFHLASFVLSPDIIWYLYIYCKHKCNHHYLCL